MIMERRTFIAAAAASLTAGTTVATGALAHTLASQAARLRAEFDAALVVYWGEMARAKEAYDTWQATLPGDTLPPGYQGAPECQAYDVAAEAWCAASDAVDRVADQIMAVSPSTTSELLLVAHAWAWKRNSGCDILSNCDVENYRGGDLRELVLFLEDVARREALT
jgi:hypothetical protein